MNKANTNSRLLPTQAIIVYTNAGTYKSDFYLEQRQIKSIQGKPTLMTATPVAEDVLKSIAKLYIKSASSEMEFESIIPSHILYAYNAPGKTVVIWYWPAMERSLNFSASLGIKGNSSVKVPATLYLAINGNLYVYALMNDERPTNSTKIYKAPFFNIYTDGRVCLGSAKVGNRAKSFEKEAERFERAFYMAEQNGGQSDKNCKTPLTTLWNQLLKKKTAFPSQKELMQHSFKTLGELMTKLVNNSRL